MNTPDKVIDIALSQVGYLEKSKSAYKEDPSVLYRFEDGAGSDNYTKYGKEMHDVYPKVMDFPAAWCDAFVDWCFMQAYGVSTAKSLLCGDFDDYTVASAQMYKNKGAWYTTPKVGDQIFFKNATRICHTGLVYKVENGRVYTVEGNTSEGESVIPNGGGVCKKSYIIGNTRIAGYGRPKYDNSEDGKWIQLNNGEWVYRMNDGRLLKNEWKKIRRRWYWFNEKNEAVKGHQVIDGDRYYFETNGSLECAMMITNEKGALVICETGE